VLRSQDFIIDKIENRLNKLITRKQDRLLGGIGYIDKLRKLHEEKLEKRKKRHKVGGILVNQMETMRKKQETKEKVVSRLTLVNGKLRLQS